MGRDELFNLLSHVAGKERRARLQEIWDMLPVAKPGGYRSPDKILIILFASRAGSNYLGQLLTATGYFRKFSETFNPPQILSIKKRERLPDVESAVQWMIDNRGTESAFGFKAGIFGLVGSVKTGFLPEVLDRGQFLLLRRRDRVAQAISMFRLQLSGRKQSFEPEWREIRDEHYDADTIALQVRRIQIAERNYADLLALLGKDPPIIYYEDICADPKGHTESICNALGLDGFGDGADASVTLKPIRDELSQEWADRFRRERPGVC